MSVTTSAYRILRVGMGITFLWIGILIFRDPIAWGGFIQPWALKLLLVPLRQTMISTAILDMILGVLFLIDRWTWIAAFLASAHLVIILVTSGINEVTVRDIGLLGATIALTIVLWPGDLKNIFKMKRVAA